MAEILRFEPQLDDEILVRMNHREWLTQLAAALEAADERRGIAMTPFRSGAIQRLRLAVKFLALQEKLIGEARRLLAAASGEIEALRRENRLLKEELHGTGPADDPDDDAA